MVTKRTPIARPGAQRITTEALAAFSADDWIGLHRALGLRPWEASPLDVDGEPPAWLVDPDDWRRAQAQRRALKDVDHHA